jgi:hypothetical protein
MLNCPRARVIVKRLRGCVIGEAAVKLSVGVAWAGALLLAVLLILAGVPVGIAATTAVLVVGLSLFLAGRAVTNLRPDSTVGSFMVVPGTILLFMTAVSGLLLGKEYWPRVNAFLLFAGGLIAVVVLCVAGGFVIDRLVPGSRSSDPRFRVIGEGSSPESQRLAREFFGDGRSGPAA